MILLDTDHLTVLRFPDNLQCVRLKARLQSSAESAFATTIVNVEEQMRGWLAEISRVRVPHKQTRPYDALARLFEFYQGWRIARFDAPSVSVFESLRKQRLRIGTMDLKIASIALANDALLLTANLRDFRRVPGLRVENWLLE